MRLIYQSLILIFLVIFSKINAQNLVKFSEKECASASLSLLSDCVSPSPPSFINTISITTTTATINFSAGSGTNRLIVLNAGSQITGFPNNGSTYTASSNYNTATVQSPFNGKIVYAGTGVSVNLTTLTNNTTYFGVIYEFDNATKCYSSAGSFFSFTTISAESDIVAVAGSENECISSIKNGLINSVSDGTQVWQFAIRDGGPDIQDEDILPTILTGLMISQGISNGIADWTNIQDAALFDGSILIAHASIYNGSLSFNSLSVTVDDNSTKTISLRITLKSNTNIPLTIDGKKFRFSIIAPNITLASSGSSSKNNLAPVATTNLSSNIVCVIATRLYFDVQPVSTFQNFAINPAVKVSAIDANGNLDLGFLGEINIRSSGAVLSGATTIIPGSGTATFSDLKLSNTSIGATLTASSVGLADAISNPFDIMSSTGIFTPGDLAIIGINTNWNANSGGADEISLVIFKDMQPGTILYMTDNGYERNVKGKWGATEGVVKIKRNNSVLTAGSVITIRGIGISSGGFTDNSSFEARTCINGAFASDPNFTISYELGSALSSDFNLNLSDQVWITHGGTWTRTGSSALDNADYVDGNVLFGWSGIDWKTSPGYASTKGSTIFGQICCFTNTLGGSTGVDKVKYTGPMTIATRLIWISRINNSLNWTKYADDISYQSGPDYSGYVGAPDICNFLIQASTEQDGLWTGAKNKDWFDCNNWDSKIVPTTTTNVTIPTNALNTCTIDKINFPNTASIQNNIATCQDLTIDGNLLSMASTSDTINVYGNSTLKNNATLNLFKGGTINMLNGNLNISSSNFITWNGNLSGGSSSTVNYFATGIQTIASLKYYNLKSGSSGDRILSNAGIIEIANSFMPNFPAQTYTITGSTIDFNGVGVNQNIPGFNFYNVGYKNGGIKSLLDHNTVYKSLTIGNNSQTNDDTKLALNDYDIHLHSDQNNTANICATSVPKSNISFGSGGFVIERYLPMRTQYAGRRWRLMGVPIHSTNAPTINASWQEGQVSEDRFNPMDIHPPYGTSITNGTISHDGFDQGSTANPSIYTIEPERTEWIVPSSTNLPITNYHAYMLFVRGNRSIIISNQYINTSGSANLRIKGQINIGDISVPLSIGKQIVSNPYASAITMNKLTYNGIGWNDIETNTYYLWDPLLLGSKGVGGWVTNISNGDGTTFTMVPNPIEPNIMNQYSNEGIIESSGAVLLIGNTSGSELIFHENAKLNTSSTIGIASRNVSQNRSLNNLSEEFFINLAYRDANDKALLADGVATIYGDEFNNELDKQDAIKLQSFQTKEKIGLLRNENMYSIERRHTISKPDTIFLQLIKLDSNFKYQLQFVVKKIIHPYTVILIDNFLNKIYNIATNEITIHNFETSGNAASLDNGRFMLIISPKNEYTVPIKLNEFNVTRQFNSANIEWKVQEEIEIKKYEVEKSLNGADFEIKKSFAANQTSTYHWSDNDLSSGTNFYRIRIIKMNGEIEFSQVKKIILDKEVSDIFLLSENINNGIIQLKFCQMPEGIYEVRLVNAGGQNVFHQSIKQFGKNSTKSLNIKNQLAKGVYHLEILYSGKIKKVFTFENL